MCIRDSVNILPENTHNLPGQLTYTGHQQVDQNGQLGPMQSQPVSPAPDGQSPGKNTSTPDALRSAVDKDLASHSRRGSTVYGGAGSGAVSTISALADGQGISREEAGQIATDTAVGSIAAKADDVLSSRVTNPTTQYVISFRSDTPYSRIGSNLACLLTRNSLSIGKC